MNVANRKPGTSTTFIDAASEEAILQLAADEGGLSYVAFHLYDRGGSFVAESSLEHHSEGVTICCNGGEALLVVPDNPNDGVQYRLYNSLGNLLTASDGVRTMIYPQLRMEGVRRDWTPPSADQREPLPFPFRRVGLKVSGSPPPR